MENDKEKNSKNEVSNNDAVVSKNDAVASTDSGSSTEEKPQTSFEVKNPFKVTNKDAKGDEPKEKEYQKGDTIEVKSPKQVKYLQSKNFI